MSELESDLEAFYDQQAAGRAAGKPDPEREARRPQFAELLRSEARTTVIELGTGPGHDAEAMQAAGLHVSGIDLSAEHVRYCRERGIDCRQASLFNIPFEDSAFQAGWTMSTLLHVPYTRIHDALLEITRVLEPGAPIAVGVWGGPDREEHRMYKGIDIPRFFSSRNDTRWRATLERYGAIERFDTWPDPHDTFHYQYAILRTHPA